jgi:hypothetical protein
MRTRSRFGRIALAAILAATGLGVTSASAGAAFHLMSIREVHAASPGDYVELQMYASGQNFVDGHTITTYDSTGAQTGAQFVFPSGASSSLNGGNQRTIRVGQTGAGADFEAAFDVVSGSGGAVCFDAIDCVTFGAYIGVPLGSPTGTPAVQSTGIPVGGSIERTIAPGCSTLLESGDDTNDSATDFSLQPPSPRNNATAPTETPCSGGQNPGGGPDTKIDKGPKKKTKKKKAVFEFSSTTPGATFECELDGGKAFTPCTSPFQVKVRKGKHSFQVRAVLNGVPDGSPAEQSWKVKKKKKRK